MFLIQAKYLGISLPPYKANIYEREWSKFDHKTFILDYFSVNWEDLPKIDEQNAGNLNKIYLVQINVLLDPYVPLKRIKFKPWM